VELSELIQNFVNGILLTVLGWFSSKVSDGRKKKILRDRLLKDKRKWRSMKSLCNSIREDETTTKRLLIEIGARASTADKNVWTLER
jgi:hypothetical protein